LFPKPGFPFYEARAAFSNLEARHFNLIPERGWEVDLDHVEALADENTVAIVIINPGNPCGNVFTYQHLSKVIVLKLRCFRMLQLKISVVNIVFFFAIFRLPRLQRSWE